MWIYAEQICGIVFGLEFAAAAPILRYIIPLIVIVLPTYIFGFPALSPIGAAKWANISVEVAMINQVMGVSILFLINKVNVYSICIVTIISEAICLSIRLAVFAKRYYKLITYEKIA